MTASGSDFRQTWLWRHAFDNPRTDSTPDEQEFFRTHYLSIRDRAAQLASRIATDVPGLTVHDISHLDALWDIASSVAEGAVSVNPAGAFVLGGSILLHDAAMSVAAYPGGLSDLRQTVAWRDTVARLALSAEERGEERFDTNNPPDAVIDQVLPDVLRQLHAEHAEELAEQAWNSLDGPPVHLVEDSDLRTFYGPTMGQIAHSHWWPVQRLEQEFSEDLGALASRTRCRVDRLILACLLRVADALHLDSRRAPRFLRAITDPKGTPALHWTFQERLARPHIELDAVVFTTGQPFAREEADAWWLAYDALNAADRELHDVDLLLQARGREILKARRIKGAGSPEILARSLPTSDWRPVDAMLRVSDVPAIVERLGGAQLYGDNPTVALRELIQNAADAIQARRRFEGRPGDWGSITVELIEDAGHSWLVVEDNGIGMAENVLTGPLLDFGNSFWRSPLATEEFPGLMAAGMQAIGRFGIGFFSVFMLGPVVRVYSRRCDRGHETGRLLEFRGGTSARPILSPSSGPPMPIDGGTRIEVQLQDKPHESGGLLEVNAYFRKTTISLEALVGSLAPNLDVSVMTKSGDDMHPVSEPGDWLSMDDVDFLCRLHPILDHEDPYITQAPSKLMQPIVASDGRVFGRAFIWPDAYSLFSEPGWITVSGLRAARLRNVRGVLLGEAVTASRDSAKPLAPQAAMASWATKQAEIISAAVADEELQARSAEVVLECGGRLGELKIVQWGGQWMSDGEFEQELRCSSFLAVNFDGEFEYDEHEDDVFPREFADNFELSGDVALVPKLDGSICRIGNDHWPKSLAERKDRKCSNIGEHVRKMISRIWGSNVEESRELCAVGMVGGTPISRQVLVFRCAQNDGWHEVF